MRLGHVCLDCSQSLAKQGVLKSALTCNLKFGEHCVLDKKTNVKFGNFITAQKVFLIVVLLRLHRLEAIDTLSLLLMIHLGVVGYTL